MGLVGKKVGKRGSLFRTPFFRQMLKEWAINMKSRAHPSLFVNMFLGWSMEPSRDGRECLRIAKLIHLCPWSIFLREILPNVTPEDAEVFKSKAAERFYGKFQSSVSWETYKRTMALARSILG